MSMYTYAAVGSMLHGSNTIDIIITVVVKIVSTSNNTKKQIISRKKQIQKLHVHFYLEILFVLLFVILLIFR